MALSQHCPNGYSLLAGIGADKCYRFRGNPTTFPAAEDICSEQGTLVSIGNAFVNFALQDFIASIVNNGTNFWIGLQNEGSGWAWLDGAPNNYVNWGRAQPGIDTCVSMDSMTAKWFTTECSTALPFLCEAESTAC
uniref:C-type lectin domain-containing protein n=1 Tax=Acrobeloides nanus TaxID=290746 RepID=A0A914EII6_9BILA